MTLPQGLALFCSFGLFLVCEFFRSTVEIFVRSTWRFGLKRNSVPYRLLFSWQDTVWLRFAIRAAGLLFLIAAILITLSIYKEQKIHFGLR